MALDVEPLSPRRRAAMLLALLVLFGASLGFAELLVRRQPGALLVNWHLPNAELKRVLNAELEDSTGGEVWAGEVFGRPRFVVGIVEEAAKGEPRLSRLAAAQKLLLEVLDAPATQERAASLGGRPAAEVEGSTEEGDFGVLRLVVVEQTTVAICYRGAGKITDGDREYWDKLCAHVEIRGPVPRAGK